MPYLHLVFRAYCFLECEKEGRKLHRIWRLQGAAHAVTGFKCRHLHVGAAPACVSRPASLCLEKGADNSPYFPGLLGSLSPHGAEHGDIGWQYLSLCYCSDHLCFLFPEPLFTSSNCTVMKRKPKLVAQVVWRGLTSTYTSHTSATHWRTMASVTQWTLDGAG